LTNDESEEGKIIPSNARLPTQGNQVRDTYSNALTNEGTKRETTAISLRRTTSVEHKLRYADFGLKTGETERNKNGVTRKKILVKK
jgi:hypothetical protein